MIIIWKQFNAEMFLKNLKTKKKWSYTEVEMFRLYFAEYFTH